MCTSCGKKTTLSGGRNRAVSAPPTPSKKRLHNNGMGSPYGTPKVRMSFGRNR